MVNNMTTITIRVSEEDRLFYEYMAKFYGTSLSDLIKTKSMEALEDEFDRQTLRKIREENSKDPNYRLISADEIKKELGL